MFHRVNEAFSPKLPTFFGGFLTHLRPPGVHQTQKSQNKNFIFFQDLSMEYPAHGVSTNFKNRTTLLAMVLLSKHVASFMFKLIWLLL